MPLFIEISVPSDKIPTTTTTTTTALPELYALNNVEISTYTNRHSFNHFVEITFFFINDVVFNRISHRIHHYIRPSIALLIT